ncbi:MAG: murein transglycosylase domain-containing protein [Gammaproteobacteria bacterium]
MNILTHSNRLSLFLFLIIMVFAARSHAAEIKIFNTWLDENRPAADYYDKQITRQYQRSGKQDEKTLSEFVRLARTKWGKGNVLIPKSKIWVQYEDDLELRSSVDFEKGVARVQMLLEDKTDAGTKAVRKRLENAVEQLFLGKDEGPVKMMKRLTASKKAEAKTAVNKTETKPEYYTVLKGDTLWGLSRRFNVSRNIIAQHNNMGPDDWLLTGQRIYIPGRKINDTSVQRKRDRVKTSANKPDIPLLHGQIRNSSGTLVTHENVAGFAKEVAASQRLKRTRVHSTDGINRVEISFSFRLVPNHLKIRAQRFSTFVRRYSEKLDVYAPLILAVIHTESAFNPMARSSAPAYGLMQLVPGSGARDAYLMVYGIDKHLAPEYLYDPENNIELGTAYLHILSSRYLRSIENQTSRMYCAIAAYNTGTGNVSRAFSDGASIRQAAPVINRMSSDQVYNRLRSDLPYEETRNYIKRVRDRIPLYEE